MVESKSLWHLLRGELTLLCAKLMLSEDLARLVGEVL